MIVTEHLPTCPSAGRRPRTGAQGRVVAGIQVQQLQVHPSLAVNTPNQMGYLLSSVILHWLAHHNYPKSIVTIRIHSLGCTFMGLFLVLRSLSRVRLFVTPMDFSTPGFPVHHQLLELAQTPIHQVSDAIQPSHPLLPSSPPALSLSQHQGLFQWVDSLHQVGKVFGDPLQEIVQLKWGPCFSCPLHKYLWTESLKSLLSRIKGHKRESFPIWNLQWH